MQQPGTEIWAVVKIHPVTGIETVHRTYTDRAKAEIEASLLRLSGDQVYVEKIGEVMMPSDPNYPATPAPQIEFTEKALILFALALVLMAAFLAR